MNANHSSTPDMTLDISKAHEASINEGRSLTSQCSSSMKDYFQSLPQNISSSERIGSTLGGAALVAAGLAKGRMSGLLMTLAGGALLVRGATGHCQAYERLGINSNERANGTSVASKSGERVEKSIVVERSAADLYAFWRDVENLPKVMPDLVSIDAVDNRRSRWVASGLLGTTLQWEAEIFNEREPEMIAWRSLPGGDIDTAGSIHFNPQGDSKTNVVVSMKYNPPAGKVGAAIASILGDGLEDKLQRDLRSFKALMESKVTQNA